MTEVLETIELKEVERLRYLISNLDKVLGTWCTQDKVLWNMIGHAKERDRLCYLKMLFISQKGCKCYCPPLSSVNVAFGE